MSMSWRRIRFAWKHRRLLRRLRSVYRRRALLAGAAGITALAYGGWAARRTSRA